MADAPTASEPRFVAVLWSAATRPSLAALVGTLLVAGALLALCVELITPDRLVRVDPGYLMADGRDDYASVTLRALALAADADGPKPLTVVLLGASSLREAIWSETEMERTLSDAAGEPVRVLNLAAVGARTWEQASIADLISPGFRGVILLNVNPRNLAYTREELIDLVDHPRLGFTTDAFDNEVRLAGLEPPHRAGNYFLDNQTFFMARIGSAAHLFTGPVEPMAHRVTDEDPNTPQEMARKVRRHQQQLTGYYELREGLLGVLARMIDRIRVKRASRVEFVFLEGMRNPKYADEIYVPPMRQKHTALMEAFTAANHAAYWDLDAATDLRPDEFFDFVHLQSSDAKRRYTHELTERLVPLVRRIASKGATP